MIRDENAFQCYLENFSVAGIIRQYYEHQNDQNDSTEYQNFTQWYSEVYPDYEQITSWQFKMYQEGFDIETSNLISSVSTLSPTSSSHHDESNLASEVDSREEVDVDTV